MLLFFPIICFASPFLSHKKGGILGEMEYLDLVFTYGFIWICLLSIIWTWKNIQTQKEFSINRKYFKKKIISTKIIEKHKSKFKFYENLLQTNLEGELGIIEISKDDSDILIIGNEIQLEIEETSNTILNLEKI